MRASGRHVALSRTWRIVFVVTLSGAVACARAPGPSVAATAMQEADHAARAAVAAEDSLGVAAPDPRMLAVLPFAAPAGDSLLEPLGYALSELLVTDLSRSAQLDLVDRLRLEALRRELRLAAEGLLDTATAPRIGRLAGARRIVTGGLASGSAADSELVLAVRVLDTPTGAVVSDASAANPGAAAAAAFSASAPLARILDAEKALAFRIFDALGVVLTPAERVAVSERPTDDVAALVAYGRGVRAEYMGAPGEAARHFRDALRIDPAFGEASRQLQIAGQRAAEVGRGGEIVAGGESGASRSDADAAAAPGTAAPVVAAPAAVAPSATQITVVRTSGAFGPPMSASQATTAPTSSAADPAFPSDIFTMIIVIRIP